MPKPLTDLNPSVILLDSATSCSSLYKTEVLTSRPKLSWSPSHRSISSTTRLPSIKKSDWSCFIFPSNSMKISAPSSPPMIFAIFQPRSAKSAMRKTPTDRSGICLNPATIRFNSSSISDHRSSRLLRTWSRKMPNRMKLPSSMRFTRNRRRRSTTSSRLNLGSLAASETKHFGK